MPEKITDQQFTDSLEKIVAETRALGVSAAVIQSGRKWVGTGGYRTLEKRDRLDPFDTELRWRDMIRVTSSSDMGGAPPPRASGPGAGSWRTF